MPLINIINIEINFQEYRESNPGLLDEKEECYLSAIGVEKYKGLIFSLTKDVGD